MLIVVPVVVVAVPYALAQVLRLLGVLDWTDSLYLLPWKGYFWAAMVLTRVAYSVAWYYLSDWFVTLGHKWEFFWFKPERRHYGDDEAPPRDKSWDIVFWLVIFPFICVFAGELAIGLSTWQTPIWLETTTE